MLSLSFGIGMWMTWREAPAGDGSRAGPRSHVVAGGLGGRSARGCCTSSPTGTSGTTCTCAPTPSRSRPPTPRSTVCRHQRRVRLRLRLQHRHQHLPSAARLPGGHQGVARGPGLLRRVPLRRGVRPLLRPQAPAGHVADGRPGRALDRLRSGPHPPGLFPQRLLLRQGEQPALGGALPAQPRARGGAGARPASSPPARRRCPSTPRRSTWRPSTC